LVAAVASFVAAFADFVTAVAGFVTAFATGLATGLVLWQNAGGDKGRPIAIARHASERDCLIGIVISVSKNEVQRRFCAPKEIILTGAI
jgi:hypothetical protein